MLHDGSATECESANLNRKVCVVLPKGHCVVSTSGETVLSTQTTSTSLPLLVLPVVNWLLAMGPICVA